MSKIQSSSDKSSALLFPKLQTEARLPFFRVFKFPESFFLLWAKPVLTISQNFSSFIPLSLKVFLEIFFMAIIAESTFGLGEKYLAGTFITIFGSPYALTEIERMLSFLSLAIILFATSFCTIKTMLSG